ncbi:ComEC/Rec2 family competence protein [Flavobacterium sinopsychrotolerans]|uniref:Competence protein ComEC n=1 Tax=Flavobacterium sinopsychrotolerans TaxID=604089 RepID=A0A1H8QLC5_9FLAO|nr:ComEC/Rec2 family competence protein [Flavobacterium sinopsychrotolerans]SEO54801.1 competence protein ComEC [Flavobacterium sinopsychrotolerans]
MKVLQFPLARITIGFILGLLFAFYVHPSISHVFIALITSVSIFVGLYFLSKNRNQLSLYFGVGTYLLSFIIGISTQIAHTDYFQKSNYIHNTAIFEQPHFISLTIREKMKSSPFSDRYLAIVNHIDQKEQSGRIILNIQNDSLHHNLQVGNSLLIKGTLTKNKPPNNPNQFDYSKYLENKQIYAQLYADVADIKIGTEIEKNIWYYSSKLRTRIIRNLEKNNFNKTELNVAIALIMGQQQDISPDIIRDYQYAGAVHILSVSGLHIGFILLFVTFILKPIPNTKRGSFIKLITILISLSMFGIIAGLAPSVVRSVTMFSFVAIGNHLRRSVNIYHTLLVSVLLILLFEPSFLFDVGFQLSYIALFFIIWLQPLLSSIWKPKYKVSKYIWDILTVSFAAQIGTLLLSIYYFHQFPGLFFITNLIIIPLLSIIMILGVLVMLLAAFNMIPVFLSQLLEWSIYYLNKIINAIASLEQFIIQDIPLHFYLLLSSYLLLFTVIFWFKKPSFNRLAVILISITILQLSYFKIQYEIQNEEELIVFNSTKNTLIAERKGENIIVYDNDSILKTAKKNSLLKSYRIGNLSTLEQKKRLQNFIFFNGKKIFVLDSSAIYPKNIQPDIIVLTQSAKINLDRLFQEMKPKLVVADASNFKNIQKLWKASCEKQKIPFHATGEKGFYKLN